MLPLFVTLVLAAPDLPEVCAAPPTRDVAPLTTYAQKAGTLSVGLDSVATWCFDSTGQWSGGHEKAGEKNQPKGDCLTAVTTCEKAKKDLPDSLQVLVYAALADLDRPFLGERYVPKRSGIADRPSEAAECRAHNRSELFAQAQARMDLARLASQTQSEYANYKTWLFTQGLRCAKAIEAGKKDVTRKGITQDQASAVDAGSMQLASARDAGGALSVVLQKDTAPASTVVVSKDAQPASTVVVSKDAQPTSAVVVTKDTPAQVVVTKEVDAGLASAAAMAKDAGVPPVASVASVAATNKTSLGSTDSATAVPSGAMTSSETFSREAVLASPMKDKWRAFASQRAKLETDADYQSGFLASRELRECKCVRVSPTELVRRIEAKDRVPQLEADDAKNTACELCLLDAFPAWKSRASKQCKLMEELSDFELGVLERSDDGNGLPPRCFASVRAKRPAPTTAAGSAGASTQGGSTRNGAFIITKSPDAAPTPATSAPVEKPTDYAPIPAREEGRLYVRVFMSSACSAEIEPGPLTARTGDLLPVPVGAKMLTVKSACGGLAEVYFGREEKPRVSETFGKGQPLQLQFGR